MEKLRGKEVKKLAILFSVTYMVSYITRVNYGAIISEMVLDTGFEKSLLSLALTGNFITYGLGQLVSGPCGDKISPKKLVSCGLIVTVLMNLLIPFCQNPFQMLVVWCVNGFAQAFMWPPIIKMTAALLTADDYKDVMVKLAWGSSGGTIVVYLLAPLLIKLYGWELVFIASALLGLVMIFIWNRFAYDVKVEKNKAPKSEKGNKKEKSNSSVKIFLSPLLLCVLFGIVLQGMLRDGVTTWMPSYITETYNLDNKISILTGVVLPIFAIISFQVTEKLYEKKFKNPLLCAGLIFGVGSIAALALYFISGRNVVLSVVFSALLTATMHGVNLLLVCMLPQYFEKFGNVSTASGVLNSCTYIGSALSTYGIAIFAENKGWSATILLWFGVALVGALVCIMCMKEWNKKFSD